MYSITVLECPKCILPQMAQFYASERRGHMDESGKGEYIISYPMNYSNPDSSIQVNLTNWLLEKFLNPETEVSITTNEVDGKFQYNIDSVGTRYSDMCELMYYAVIEYKKII